MSDREIIETGLWTEIFFTIVAHPGNRLGVERNAEIKVSFMIVVQENQQKLLLKTYYLK